MARIRTIKPEFWTDGIMVGLSAWARLFFIGTWNFACDGGHVADDPMSLKLRILPADNIDIGAVVAELVTAGRLERRITATGQRYLSIPTFANHQKLDPRWKSKCPFCLAEGSGEFSTAPEETPQAHPDSRESRRDSPKLPDSPPRSGMEWSGVEEDLPPTAGASAPRTPARRDDQPPPETSQALIGYWLEHCRKRPPASVIGQVGRQVKAMLAEDIDPADIRAGLVAWWHKGLHPSALPALVNEHMNASPSRASPGTGLAVVASSRPSTTDQRVAAGLAIAAKFDQMGATA